MVPAAPRGPNPNMDVFADVIAKESAQPSGQLAPGLSLANAPPGSTHRVTIEQSVGGGASEWRPVPFEADQRAATCFGCEYGMCNPDESQPTLKGLWAIFRENYGVVGNVEVAKLMAEYFEEEIKKPMVAAGHDVEFTAAQIVEHIEPVKILQNTI